MIFYQRDECGDAVKRRFGDEIILPPFRGRIQSGLSTADFLEAVSDCGRLFEGEGSELLHEGRNRVARTTLFRDQAKPLEIVIKEFRPKGIDRLKSLILPSKPYKAWRGSHWLMQEGVSTPKPLLFLEKREKGMVTLGFLLTDPVQCAEEIRGLFRKLAKDELRSLLKDLGTVLAYSHRKGLIHRDLSDGNILVQSNPEKAPVFFIIDTNRVRKYRRVGIFRGMRSLVRIGVPMDLQRDFLGFYLNRLRIPWPAWVWYRTWKKSFSGWINLKKKLRLRAAAEKLRIQ